MAENDGGEAPVITVKRGEERRLLAGHPWIYANEIEPPAAEIAPGALVRLESAGGRALGLAFHNRHSLIACRLVTRDSGATIDRRFWQRRLEKALKWRERLVGGAHYRLVHAEADGFPGCVIDRFGDELVVQPNSAGMERQLPALAAALGNLLHPRAILAIAEGPARAAEGIEPLDRVLEGESAGPIEVLENGARFLADPRGQKTGWFFDQRDNRALAAKLARGRSVLDLYCHSGGFAIQALLGGATSALAVDRSRAALALARAAAALNGVAGNLALQEGDAFAVLAELEAAGRRFDCLLLDPPAFVKRRKDFHQGARAYRKLARLAAGVAAREAVLVLSSCSHHMPEADLLREAAIGISEAGRDARLIHRGGAGADHPVHPFLPESAYLKTLTFALE